MSEREPTAVELERARLADALPGWDIWTVTMFGGDTAWCAKPHGAEIATCNSDSPDDLQGLCRGWDADTYIKVTEAQLAETPAMNGRRRDMLTAQIAAARALSGRQRD